MTSDSLAKSLGIILNSSVKPELTIKFELARIERAIEQFLDRIAATPFLRSRRPTKSLSASSQTSALPSPRRSQAAVAATHLLIDFKLPSASRKPLLLLHSEHYGDKRALLKLAFDDRRAYARGSDFRTVNLALPSSP